MEMRWTDMIGQRWIDGHGGTDGWTDMEDDRWTRDRQTWWDRD